MEKLFQLASDIAKLWSNYGMSHYLPGIRNTLVLALVATAMLSAVALVLMLLTIFVLHRTLKGKAAA